MMMARFAAPRGFTGGDIERSAGKICGCDVSGFFARHVRQEVPLDFNDYLSAVGMRMTTEWTPALDDSGNVDLAYRLRAHQTERPMLRLYITDPESIWGKAGLRTV